MKKKKHPASSHPIDMSLPTPSEAVTTMALPPGSRGSKLVWKPPRTHHCSLYLVLRKVQQVAPPLTPPRPLRFLVINTSPHPHLCQICLALRNTTTTSDLLLFFLTSMPPRSTSCMKTKLACQTRMFRWSWQWLSVSSGDASVDGGDWWWPDGITWVF